MPGLDVVQIFTDLPVDIRVSSVAAKICTNVRMFDGAHNQRIGSQPVLHTRVSCQA